MVNEQTIGQVLKSGREAKGLDIEEISNVLCIAKSYLRALEDDRFDDLPCQTYAVGFLRTYSSYLGLDANELVSKIKGQNDSVEVESPVIVPEVAHDGGIPNFTLMFAGALGIGALFFLYSLYSGDVIRSETVTPPPEEILAKAQSNAQSDETMVVVDDNQVERTSVVTQSDRVMAATEIDQASAQLLAQEIGSDFEIIAVTDTWVMMVDENNAPLVEKIVHQGERLEPKFEAGYKLSADNAGGLMVYVSGAPAFSLGDRGALLESVSIEQIQNSFRTSQ